MTNAAGPLRLVMLETPRPFAVDVARSMRYARSCMADCLRLHDAPFAAHLLYTQAGVMDDSVPTMRRLADEAGQAWCEKSQATVVYTDLGVSRDMMDAIERAEAAGRPVEYRKLPPAVFRSLG